jgi:cyclophilin family peptidyl-prolyl cis-trans isomerase
MKWLALIRGVLSVALFSPWGAAAQTILSQPQSITVNNASTAEFTVVVSNAVTYQWQFNGSNLVDGAGISGSSTAALTLENVSSNEAGGYTVVVNNSVTSTPPALLTVVPGTVVTMVVSGFPGGASSNIDIQLFDHDKPATVENFLHYVASGAYSNMFFHRDGGSGVAVLQGGVYGASNQTSTNPPITGWTIPNFQPSPPFAGQVDNEFGTGPVIHNRFGTLAMAFVTSNSATSSFFFNLADNAAFLDQQNFTVFGRILDASNVLDYFGALSSLVDNAQIDANGQTVSDSFPLPVNYSGPAAPANADLFFTSFLLTNPPVDTVAPTVAITSPGPTAVITNPLAPITGTASDNLAVANVLCTLTPQAAGDGARPNEGIVVSNYAIGTSNWSSAVEAVINSALFGPVTNSMPPGVYQLSAVAQDGAGNLSAPAVQLLTNSSVVIVGPGTASYNAMNAVGYPFIFGQNYALAATPASNALFLSWTGGNLTSFDAAQSWQITNGGIITATFISNTLPVGVAFTYPSANEIIGPGAFAVTGTISNGVSLPLTLTCQIVSRTTLATVGSIQTNSASSNWSFAVAGLPLDSYSVEITAMDPIGQTTLIAEDFAVATNAALELTVVGPGMVSGATNGEPFPIGGTIAVTAAPDASNDLFFTWSDGTAASLNPAQNYTMTAGLQLTATFVNGALTNQVFLAAPPSTIILSNGTVQVAGTLSNLAAPPVTLTCQVFSATTMASVAPASVLTTATNWSFLETNLVAGPYVAKVMAVDQAGNGTILSQAFTAVVDTNLPVVTVLSPASNILLLDDKPVILRGVASDSTVPLSSTISYLAPLPGPGGVYPNALPYISANGVGTSNWSVNFGIVPAGVYQLYAEALDSAGNIGVQTNLFLTNTAVFIKGSGSVSVYQGSNLLATNAIGYPFQANETYKVIAAAAPGQRLVGWSEGASLATNATQTVVMEPGLLLTATFAPTNAAGLVITYPPVNARLGTNSFILRGRLLPGFASANVSCVISSMNSGYSVGPLAAATTGNRWQLSVTNLPPDNYLITAQATNASGQVSLVSQRFSLWGFIRAAGTYAGLFITTNQPVAPTNSGLLSFTVLPSGVFSGRMVFPAYAPIPIYSDTFANENFTTGNSVINLNNFHGENWAGTIQLDLTGGSDQALGAVVSQNWSAQLLCYRTVARLSAGTLPAPGRYVFTLSSVDTNVAAAHGYMTVTAGRNGVLAYSGALPDNTTFSGSTRVSEEGDWPLGVVPAGDAGRGLLLGWQSFAATNGSIGQCYWYKAAGIGAYDRGGIGVLTNELLDVTGTNLTLPAPGSQFSIVFSGGSVNPPLTNAVAVNSSGRLEAAGGADDHLRISLSAAGVLTGSFEDPSSSRPHLFKGIFMGPSTGGSGFFPDANGQVGRFILQP